MALSGTLDTFALPDVLRLLASTAKSGRLRVTGDRGSGSVWVDSGEVVATELASAVSQEPTAAEVIFGLLRFSAGSFTFEADAAAPNASTPAAMDPILGAAENMLVEWKAIEEVIPSLDLWVGLAAALDGPDVMVDQARWGGIAAIGSGSQVGAVAESLQLNEIDTCRLVKELLELGLVEFIDEPAGIPEATSFEPAPVEEADLEDTLAEDTAAEDTAAHDTAEDTAAEDTAAHDTAEDAADEDTALENTALEDTADGESDEMSTVFEDETPGEPEALLHELDAMDDAPSFGESNESTEPSLAALASSEEAMDDEVLSADIFAGAPGPADGDDELDPAEMARQLANLSPKAAKAVAAAAKATTDAERDAALAAVEAEDDSVNRGLLLKFLGSVDS